eukprot:3946844-Pyramimonas_sp.AAC.1
METQGRNGTAPPGDTAQRDRDSEPYIGRPPSHSSPPNNSAQAAPSAQFNDAEGTTAADATSHPTASPALTSPR